MKSKIILIISLSLIFTLGISTNNNIIANTWWSHNFTQQATNFYNGLFRSIDK